MKILIKKSGDTIQENRLIVFFKQLRNIVEKEENNNNIFKLLDLNIVIFNLRYYPDDINTIAKINNFIVDYYMYKYILVLEDE